MLIQVISAWLVDRGLSVRWASPLADLGGIVILLSCAWFINWLMKQIILRVVTSIVKRTQFGWDDIFLQCGVFTRLSHVAPALVVTIAGSEFFLRKEAWAQRLETAVDVYLVVIVLMVLFALLDSAAAFLAQRSSTQGIPLKGFTQSAKLVLILMAGVLILSLLLKRSPLYFLSGLGALTAVLLLVFKDALLGLVAGVQISVNRMIQIGDWIEMPKYGADGAVIDVSLTTVKVQNWDKTINTIPSYALISDPVKNWRGMSESGGRRIKRSVFLDMQTFRFLDEELLRKMLTFQRLRPYLEKKIPEIEAWNEQANQDPSIPVDRRRLTNVGCFRAYVEAYLRSHEQIHQDMTFLIRQLQPTDKGLPLEIYVFTKDTRWAVYEGIQADIFDHLLTVLPEFDLSVFQSPGSNDVRAFVGRWGPPGGSASA